MNAQRIA